MKFKVRYKLTYPTSGTTTHETEYYRDWEVANNHAVDIAGYEFVHDVVLVPHPTGPSRDWRKPLALEL